MKANLSSRHRARLLVPAVSAETERARQEAARKLEANSRKAAGVKTFPCVVQAERG
ncbi:hypothetical protein [Streptomyces sp. NPDC058011]|uniref:hypothetical protein n=1 Tax=Streptomyces sp. NPDC058011 TaxID=3346305 RepID=UPI0036F172F6